MWTTMKTSRYECITTWTFYFSLVSSCVICLQSFDSSDWACRFLSFFLRCQVQKSMSILPQSSRACLPNFHRAASLLCQWVQVVAPLTWPDQTNWQRVNDACIIKCRILHDRVDISSLIMISRYGCITNNCVIAKFKNCLRPRSPADGMLIADLWWCFFQLTMKPFNNATTPRDEYISCRHETSAVFLRCALSTMILKMNDNDVG